MRIIKRYKNRKLYDVETSRYINITYLVNIAYNGNAFQIVNAYDGTDITARELTTAIYQIRLRSNKFEPVEKLINEIKTEGL